VLTLANHGSRAVAYALSHTDAPALPGRDVLSELSLLPAASTVTFGAPRHPLSSITVPARGRERVPVTVTPDPALPEGALYGGELVFTPAGDGPPLRVPYAGYMGDYSAVPVLTPTARGFPWLARETGIALDSTLHVRPVYVRQDAGAAYTLAPLTFGSRTGADTPFVLAHLNSFARRLRLEVAGARGRVLGEALAEDYVPRDAVDNLVAAEPNLFTALPFDGTVRAGGRRLRLPDGDYRLILEVQGAPGGPWQRWTSPVFRIDRS
jgi:hypothetical protein